MDERIGCPFCGAGVEWHIGGENDDLLFFGCGGTLRCVSWAFAFTKPDFENVLAIARKRWNTRFLVSLKDNEQLTGAAAEEALNRR